MCGRSLTFRVQLERIGAMPRDWAEPFDHWSTATVRESLTAHQAAQQQIRNAARSSNKPVAECLRHGFGLRVDLQLLIDVLEMEVDCGGLDAQLCRGSFIIVAFDQQ